MTRRSALRLGAVAGVGVVAAACGDDESVLRDASIAIDDETSATTATPATTVFTDVSSNVTSTTATTATTTDATAAAEATATTEVDLVAGPLSAIADGAEMIVSYTYEQAAGGKNSSPYTAVWIEDSTGALVHTIVLWIEQGRKGLKYLPDLTRWFGVDQDRIASGGTDTVDAMSGPTRFPGQHSVTWNGLADIVGATPAGDYFVCIESAREDGPHSLIRESITLASQPVEVVLPDDGELIDASVSVA